MNKWESDRWDDHRNEIRRIPPKPEMIQVTVEMTAEEYNRIKNDASWDYRGGGGIGGYLLWKALGGQRKGC